MTPVCCPCRDLKVSRAAVPARPGTMKADTTKQKEKCEHDEHGTDGTVETKSNAT